LLKRSDDGRNSKITNRRPAAFLIVGTFLFFLFPFILLLIVHIPAIQRLLIAEVSLRLEKSTGIEVRLEGYRWNPISCLCLLEVKVLSSGREVIKCEKAKLSYHISWHWPYLCPEELYLERPFLILEKDEDRTFRLPCSEPHESCRPFTLERPSLRYSFPWPAIRILSGVIEAEQNGQKVLSVKNVSGTLAYHFDQGPYGPRLKLDLGQWQR